MLESMFEKIIILDNLRKAWVKAQQYARAVEIYFDEYAYNVYSEHLEARLSDLSRVLQDGSYRPSSLRYITIPKKGTNGRKIYFLTPKDSVVIQAVINVIGPIFESTFVDESYGYRLNINELESKDTYRNWQEQYSKYVSAVRGFTKYGLRSWYSITDIANYYPSISKEWLIGLISSKIDGKTLEIVRMFLNLEALGSSEEKEPVPGIPPGTLYSHFFANIYLNEFDHLAISQTLGYARYVDDICFVCGSQEQLEKAKESRCCWRIGHNGAKAAK